MTDLTLTEFLLARIDEDEAHLDAEVLNDFPPTGTCWKRLGDDRVCIRPRGHDVDSARVLAECDAKRRLVALHSPDQPYCSDNFSNADHAYFEGPCENLRLLALPYADHAEFRAEWRP